jgi:outer membrane biosynthesis protein TonB
MDESEVLTFVPQMATDEDKHGGGAPPRANPTPNPPAPEVPTPTPPPRVQETVRQPDPPPQREPVRDVEPEKSKPVSRDTRDSLDPKPEKPKPHQVQVNKKVVTIPKNRPTTTTSSNTDTTEQEKRDIERAAANARLFANASRNISRGLAPSTTVSMPEGPGGGGVSYANFAQIVRKVYTDAWRIPDDVTDDEAIVKVSVTIARDGSVISSRIIAESGSRLVDRSIQNALDRVTTIGVAFPAGAKESQRTFTISFSLKAKKLLG